MSTAIKTQYVRWFDQIGIGDVATVGGKNASLGEMYQSLAPRGVKIPNGFATTADAYRHFLRRVRARRKNQTTAFGPRYQ